MLLCLLEQAKEHGVCLETSGYGNRFLELIKTVGKDTPAVVLIDEYDKPIIDYLERSELHQAYENREILKTFYAGVKDQDKYLRFFFLTGVSKFSKVSIFSDLNHLTDITINEDCAAIIGYTEAEIVTYYSDYLELLANKFKISQEQLLEKIKDWYNGYSWDGIQFLFNPYSVINLFYAKAFRNFWFETGTPTFLINKWKESDHKLNRSMNKLVNESEFNKYDIEHINITAVMFQTGYLTIKAIDYEENKYVLDFPNKEVRDSFLNFAVEHYADSSSDEMSYIVDNLLESLHANDIECFFTTLQALFSSIAVKQLDKVKSYEGFYHSIIYIVLKILGVRIACEIQSNFGSTDAVITTDKYIYVIEFKMGKAQDAIEQIKKRTYHSPYLADKRKIVLVGFGFEKAQRNLVDYAVESYPFKVPTVKRPGGTDDNSPAFQGRDDHINHE
ncbi:MAG: hypothetical protein D3924_12120 [Candidatus Electrothrix sp. AR4]|nr:hypothetical protein [Candidatus Electrothrix sp. AR4]